MSTLTFLAGLPAILGLVGFVIYSLLRNQLVGGQITRDILAKVRVANPATLPPSGTLTKQQLFELLKSDAALKATVGGQDFLLLQQALRNEFIITVIVYSL